MLGSVTSLCQVPHTALSTLKTLGKWNRSWQIEGKGNKVRQCGTDKTSKDKYIFWFPLVVSSNKGKKNKKKRKKDLQEETFLLEIKSSSNFRSESPYLNKKLFYEVGVPVSWLLDYLPSSVVAQLLVNSIVIIVYIRHYVWKVYLN